MCTIESLHKLRARVRILLNWFKPPVIFYITDHSYAVLLNGFLCVLVLVSDSVLFSPIMCLDDI